MKTRNLTRLGALTLTMTMVTTSLIGGTLAKYTTTVSGTDTVTVARFGYEANDGKDDLEYTTGTTQSIDLFDDLTTDAKDTVAVDTDDNSYLAPGTYGSFQIELNGTNSDVDIEMSGSTVTASVDQNYASTSEDYFISYYIDYNMLDADDMSWDSITKTTYEVHRVSMDQFALDLQTVLESIILEKNSVGTITVWYAWENFDDSDTAIFGNFTTDGGVDDMTYDEADTLLGQKWTGVSGVNYSENSRSAPKFTLTISNTASQIVNNTTTPDYTNNADIIVNRNYNSIDDYVTNSGATTAIGKISNYTVTNNTTYDSEN